jgi:hypothetical protein
VCMYVCVYVYIYTHKYTCVHVRAYVRVCSLETALSCMINYSFWCSVVIGLHVFLN